MSKILNDCLTRSDTGCFIAVYHMATLGVKVLKFGTFRRRTDKITDERLARVGGGASMHQTERSVCRLLVLSLRSV